MSKESGDRAIEPSYLRSRLLANGCFHEAHRWCKKQCPVISVAWLLEPVQVKGVLVSEPRGAGKERASRSRGILVL